MFLFSLTIIFPCIFVFFGLSVIEYFVQVYTGLIDRIWFFILFFL